MIFPDAYLPTVSLLLCRLVDPIAKGHQTPFTVPLPTKTTSTAAYPAVAAIMSLFVAPSIQNASINPIPNVKQLVVTRVVTLL